MRAVAADRQPRKGGPTAATATASTPAAQRAALCAKAEASLRETWQREREAAALQAAYRGRRLARVAAARAGLLREPRDLGALIDEARGLFADEDALLSKVGGAAAQALCRAEQVEGRTVILAIAAAMADRDWDEAIRW